MKNKITVDDTIIIEPESVVKTDEMNRGPAGKDGKVGPKGRDGKDGIDGKDGKNGKDGRDGKNGVDGASGVDGKNGRDGINGAAGKNGRDGKNGPSGINGQDGSKWHLFKNQPNEKKGALGDFCLVHPSMHCYHREETSLGLIWKFVGTLKGDKGEIGERGADGRDGGGGGGGSQGGGSGFTFVTVPISITIGQINTWVSVPHFISNVAESEAFDSLNQEKIELDIRIIPPQNIQIRSKKINTYNVRIIGE